ncbi:uncharacterized protein LOC117805448 [Notolabrus celidotus]|uniref:uncharacterized protein LOC117805448 n=1 Tax=Notolabrus celidotus TaxID=1203425 RepID=UPI0014905AB1|nr:uncharacterized protein LOC117805448 [Notolabrus celidotus]
MRSTSLGPVNRFQGLQTTIRYETTQIQRRFLRFAYQGKAYEYQVIPFGLALAPRVFTKCVEAALSPLRSSGIRIFSYIDDYLICSHSREQGNQRFGCGDRGEINVSHALPLPFRAGKSHIIQTMPTPARPHGFSDICSAPGASDDEGFSALSSGVAPLPAQTPQPASESNADVFGCAPPVEGRCGSRVRRRARHGVIQGNHDDGRVPVRLGSDLVGQNSERYLEPEAGSGPHKCFRALGSVPSFTAFPAVYPGSPCSGENGQLHSGGVYKPPRRDSLTTVTHVGSENDHVEQHTAPVTSSDTCARGVEQGGGSSVTGEPAIRGMDTPSAGGGTNMAEIRPGSRRSLRLARKRSVSAVFLPVRGECPSRYGCSSPPMAGRAALCISSAQPDLSHISQGETAEFVADSDCTTVDIEALGSRDNTNSGRRAVASPHTQGSSDPSARRDLPPAPGPHSTLGLARERWNLNAAGLPAQVIDTIQSARAPATRSLYSGKWRVFEEWCVMRQIVPYQCSVVDLLSFLQELVDKKKAFSTIKVYLAAISACHVGFGDKPVGQHPLVCRFMKGARRKLPVSRLLVPLWDLSVVLDALSRHPFEPMGAVEMKFVPLKTALILALTTAKRVSDLQALSIRPSCLQFGPGLTKVCLRPNPVFVPKVLESAYKCPTVELLAFHPPPFSSVEEQRLHTLCPVRALHMYMCRTAEFRKEDQLFVSWATPHRGKPLSRQRLSHWIVEAISLAYSSKGLQPPQDLRAHSTRSMATSWALFKGVSVQDICAAASWASPHTFVRFYRLDVSGPSLAQAVLDKNLPLSL